MSEIRCQRSEVETIRISKIRHLASGIWHLASPHGVARRPAAVALVDGAAVDIAVVGEAGIAEAAVRIGRIPGREARAFGGRPGTRRPDRYVDVGAARVLAAHRLDLDHIGSRGGLDREAHRKRSGRGRRGHECTSRCQRSYPSNQGFHDDLPGHVGESTCTTRLAIIGRVFAPYAAMYAHPAASAVIQPIKVFMTISLVTSAKARARPGWRSSAGSSPRRPPCGARPRAP